MHAPTLLIGAAFSLAARQMHAYRQRQEQVCIKHSSKLMLGQQRFASAGTGAVAVALPTDRSSPHSSHHAHPRSAIKRVSTTGSTHVKGGGSTGGRRESEGAHGLKAPHAGAASTVHSPHHHHQQSGSNRGFRPSHTGNTSFKKSSLNRVSDKGSHDVWQRGMSGQSFNRVSITGDSTGGRRESKGWGPSPSGRRSSLRFNAPSPQGDGLASRMVSMARTLSISTGGWGG
jgi:hypothetical protein